MRNTEFMDKKRFFPLDFLRVIALFCIIWCHTNNIEYDSLLFEKFKWFLGKCGVPIFFMLSGYLAFPFKGDIKEYILKKSKRILIPFFIWIVIYVFVAWDLGFNLFAGDLLNKASAHLWFIYVIVGLYLLVPILSPFLENAVQNILKFYLMIWGITSIYPLLFSITNTTFTEHNIMYTLYYFYGFIGFFVLGYYFKRFPNTKLLKIPTSIALIILTFLLIGSYFYMFDCHTVEISDYKGLPMILYSIAVFALFKNIALHIQNGFVIKIMTSLSINSFGIYLVHMLIVFYIYPIIPVFDSIPDIIVTFYFVLINLLLSYLLVSLMRKIKYSNYLLG